MANRMLLQKGKFPSFFTSGKRNIGSCQEENYAANYYQNERAPIAFTRILLIC
jgi:hypothetical protein